MVHIAVKQKATLDALQLIVPWLPQSASSGKLIDSRARWKVLGHL